MTRSSSLELAVETTLGACAPFLPPAPARLLEVGCGDGRLAATLSARGYAVSAIDEDPERVAEAMGRGVAARQGRWPYAAASCSFDAVLFTRSLHHVHDLEAGLDAARAALAPGAVLVVEDWAWETVDRPTAALVAGAVEVARRAGLGVGDDWPEQDVDPLAHWLGHLREHGVHPWSALGEALASRFEPLSEVSGPYYYRYFCTFLASLEDGLPLARAVLQLERTLIDESLVRPLGRTWVGR